MNKDNAIPYARQNISEDDILAVEKVLKSDFLTQGSKVTEFEKKLSIKTHAKYCVTTNSATSALHLACLALDLGPGDILWTSPNTFVASANVSIMCGAEIDFIDIDPKTYNICVDTLCEKLINANKIGKLPKIVMPVHFAGQPCDMKKIKELSKQYGFYIIEDASHAIGAKYLNTPKYALSDKISSLDHGGHVAVGSCKYSDITVFSFHPVKIITSGEGGCALTNSYQISEKIKILRSHGVTQNLSDFSTRHDDEIWNYQQIYLGYNYRMTDIQAALGISQLSRIENFLKRRYSIASIYNEKLINLPIDLPWQDPNVFSALHLYPITLSSETTKNLHSFSQKGLYKSLWENGIKVNLHYIPVYLHPYYETKGFKKEYCPQAEKYYKSALSIPIYPDLTIEMQDRVVNAIKEYFQ